MFRDDISMIKGNHLLQVGGIFENNYDYHLRNDNGQGTMNAPVYQITGGPSVPGVKFPSAYIPAGVPSSQVKNYESLYSEVLGTSASHKTSTRGLARN